MRIELTLDCVNLAAAAAFWQAALGYAREGTIGGRYVALSGESPNLTLQRVPDFRQCLAAIGAPACSSRA